MAVARLRRCGSNRHSRVAPKYFDFVNDETEDEVRAAERWFEASVSHAPSPFAPRIKESRMEVKIDSLCDSADAEPAPKKEAVEEAAGGVTNPAGDVDGMRRRRKTVHLALYLMPILVASGTKKGEHAEGKKQIIWSYKVC